MIESTLNALMYIKSTVFKNVIELNYFFSVDCVSIFLTWFFSILNWRVIDVKMLIKWRSK